MESPHSGGKVLVAASSLLALSMIFVTPSISHLSAAVGDDVTPEEYDVYNTVLSVTTMAKDAHILIFDDTLNLQCGFQSGNPILLNGCSGMIMPPDTPEQIAEKLRQEWPHFADATWSEFKKRNTKSFKLTDAFLTPWVHKLSGKDMPEDDSKEWQSPYGGFYFSRVGFDPSKAEAVVFVFFSSSTDGVPSTGNYFKLVVGEDQKWKLDGRFEYFKSGGESN